MLFRAPSRVARRLAFAVRLERASRGFASASLSEFAKLELGMWEAGAVAYETSFAKLTGQATCALLDGAGVTMTRPAARAYVEKTELSAEDRAAGLRVLDVATGPGLIAGEAAFRGASSVVALDFSAEMLKVARAVADLHPGVIELLEADAAAVPLPDASVDAVVIGFGLLHFPDPQSVLAESFRLLKPGGKLSYSVWEPTNSTISAPVHQKLVTTPAAPTGFEIIIKAIQTHGNPKVELPNGPDGDAPLPFFHFADEGNAKKALGAAGFDVASVVRQPLPVRAPLRDADSLFQMFATATARTRATLEMQSAAELAAIKEEVASQVMTQCSGVLVDHVHRRTSWSIDQHGVEEVMHKSTAPGKEYLGGRRPYTVAMPAVVFSATRPA